MDSRRNIIHNVAFSLTLVSQLAAQAPGLRLDQIWLEHGLSQSTVNAIVQDAEGFMWFGTQDGLNRFDGYSITVFRHSPDDPGSIASNSIRSLLSGRHGDLWISTMQGVDRYVLSENRIYHYKQKADDSTARMSVSENNVSTLYEDSHGDIWVGTSSRGLNRLNPATGTLTRFSFGDQDTTTRSGITVQSICEDRAENLWVATSEGLLRLNLDSLNAVSGATAFVRSRHIASKGTTLKGENIHTLYVDREGTLWIGTWGAGLYRFDNSTNAFKQYRHDAKNPRSISSNFITSILEDSRGNLWIATQTGGVTIFNPQRDTFDRYLDEDVQTLYEDRSGIVWIGTFARGVKAYDWRKDRFQHIYVEPNNLSDLNSNLVSAILEGRDGELWVGTYGGGLHRFARPLPSGQVPSGQLLGRDRPRRRIVTLKFDPKNSKSISSNRILSLCETIDGSIWVGTDGGGLNRFDKRTGRFTQYSELGFGQISALFEDREGKLWIGSNNGGIMSFHVGTNGLTRYRAGENNSRVLAGGPVFVICEDKRGTLWVGAVGGAYHFIPEFNEIRRYQPSLEPGRSVNNNTVTSIYEDDTGIVWMGTTGGGLNRFDPATGAFTYLTEQDGLPNNFVYGILPDRKGHLWLSTNKGISRFDTKSTTFRNYDMKDGLQANEFNQGAHFASSHGELFFGGMNGVTAFFPDSIRHNAYVPPVYVTTFKVFDETLPLYKPIATAGQIELAYAQNFFSFEFVALNYSSPEKNRYAYMIEGFDKGWHEVSASHRYASYTNLDPGEYVLRVRGSNNDGVWNESGAAITIIVTPPFWMTWWFRALVVATMAGVVIALYNYRVQQLLKVEQMRVRIAADLHDEIGSSLGSIVLRSRLLQKQVRLTRTSKEELGRIHRTAVQTAAMMRNIVWFVNPDFDTLDDMILRMKDIAQSLLAGIQYEFIAPDKVLSTKLPLEFRRNIFLSYEEILHNIAKHSKATMARIEARTLNGTFLLEISDNGVGFDGTTTATAPNTTATGNGLRNLTKRMSALGGEVKIESTLNRGTTIRLSARTT